MLQAGRLMQGWSKELFSVKIQIVPMHFACNDKFNFKRMKEQMFINVLLIETWPEGAVFYLASYCAPFSQRKRFRR